MGALVVLGEKYPGNVPLALNFLNFDDAGLTPLPDDLGGQVILGRMDSNYKGVELF